MKRRDLMRWIARHAKDRHLDVMVIEGGNHTKVMVGDAKTVVPRHSEINEITARKILPQIGVTS